MKEPSIGLVDVHYKQCQLTPTDDKMKPVILLEYPFNPELAGRMNAGWMFDGLGNAISFAGAITLDVKYAGATIFLKTSNSKNEKLELKSQKIVSLRVSHGEGKGDDAKAELIGSMRIHLPNVDMDDNTAVTNLFDTLKFLVRLNKGTFDLQIDPAQQSLFTGDEQPAEPGAPTEAVQTYRMEFKAKIARKDGITGYIEIVAVKGGYCCGWQIHCPGIKGEPAAGELVKDDSQVFEKRDSAIVHGCGEVLDWMNKGLDVSKVDEEKAVETVRAWCFAQAPGLKRTAVA